MRLEKMQDNLTTEKSSLFVTYGDSLEVYIRESVLKDLNKHIQHPGDLERGGILMGKIYPSKVVIEKITHPQSTDHATETSYIRNTQGHQEELEKIWMESDKYTHYVGEWHTHSEDYPIPSSTDLEFLYSTQTYKSVNHPTIMIIQGLKDIWMGAFIRKLDCREFIPFSRFVELERNKSEQSKIAKDKFKKFFDVWLTGKEKTANANNS